ncbi:MAG: hypothetical protein KAY24_00140 [Candidatus Eisenbacteria sp.]|nr:hypothetical protein [Candidatus Eisenbacteria bacterium]
MSHVLTLTDGTTTVKLAEANTNYTCKLIRYIPKTPALSKVVMTAVALQDGGEESRVTRRNVSEFAIVQIKAATNDYAREGVRDIEGLFLSAEHFQRAHKGDRVYVQLQPGGSGETYRSEVLSGKVEIDPRTLEELWQSKAIKVKVTWTRRFYWEGEELTLPLSNCNGDIQVSGLIISNHDDSYTTDTLTFVAATRKITDSANGLASFDTGDKLVVSGSALNDGRFTITTGGVAGEIVVSEALAPEAAGATVTLNAHDNWVAVAAANITGVISAPCEVRIKNQESSGRSYRAHIGLNAFSTPGTFQHVLEGQDKAYANGGAGATAEITSSGGKYQPITVPTAEAQILRWDLTSAQLNAFAGGYFRMMARFHTLPNNDVYIRPKVTFPAGAPTTVVSECKLVHLNTTYYTQSLGVVQLPPWLIGTTDFYPCSLTFYGYADVERTLNLDCIFLMPLDGHQVLEPKGYGFAEDVTLVSSGILGEIWTEGWDTGGKTGHYIAYGPHLHIHPGKDQRFYFVVFGSASASHVIDRRHQIIIKYRPRRLTL